MICGSLWISLHAEPVEVNPSAALAGGLDAERADLGSYPFTFFYLESFS